MGVIEICAVLSVILLLLIFVLVRKILAAIEYERTHGVGNRLHFAIDGIISLVPIPSREKGMVWVG